MGCLILRLQVYTTMAGPWGSNRNQGSGSVQSVVEIARRQVYIARAENGQDASPLDIACAFRARRARFD